MSIFLTDSTKEALQPPPEPSPQPLPQLGTGREASPYQLQGDDGGDYAPNVIPWTPTPQPWSYAPEEDAAQNASSWQPQQSGYDPYSRESLSEPYMPPPQPYYDASASLGETASRAGGMFNPFSQNSVFGTFAPDASPIVQELARPSNYIGVGGGFRSLARAAGANVVGRLAGDAAMDALPEDANPYLRGGVGLAAGLVGGGVGYGAVSGAERVGHELNSGILSGERGSFDLGPRERDPRLLPPDKGGILGRTAAERARLGIPDPNAPPPPTPINQEALLAQAEREIANGGLTARTQAMIEANLQPPVRGGGSLPTMNEAPSAPMSNTPSSSGGMGGMGGGGRPRGPSGPGLPDPFEAPKPGEFSAPRGNGVSNTNVPEGYDAAKYIARENAARAAQTASENALRDAGIQAQAVRGGSDGIPGATGRTPSSGHATTNTNVPEGQPYRASLLSEAQQLMAGDPSINPQQRRELLGSLDLWLKQADSIRTSIGETAHGRVASFASRASGNLADSYLTALYQRKEWIEAAMERNGLPQATIDKVSQKLMDNELAQRYPGGVPERLKAEIAKTKLSPDSYVDTALRGAAVVSQEWKNIAFGPADVGVFGNQFLKAVQSAPVQIVAGTVNRALNLLGTGLETTLLDSTQIAKRLQYAMDGVPQNVSTGIVQDAKRGLLGHVGTERFNVGRFVDASSRFQFGTVLGGLRNLIHEGNLVSMHLLGEDITNPAVRATSAANANSATSWAPRALNADRALAESATLLTPSMRRAQVTQILQMGKILSPAATPVERKLAAMTILSLVGANLAVGKAVHDAIGIGDYEFDPSKKGWGNITTKLIDPATGLHLVVPVFPSEQIATTVLRSVRELHDGDTTEAAKEWAKLFMGSSSPVLQAVEKAAGYGYQPGRGYRFGDLKGGLLNVLPLPPIFQSYFTGDLTPQTAPLEAAGFNPYTESTATAVGRGEYGSLKGEAQLQAIGAEAWHQQQADSGAPPEFKDFKSYTDWSKAKQAELFAQGKAETPPAGKQRATDGEITAWAKAQVAKSPDAKAFARAVKPLNNQWTAENPQLALDLYDKFTNLSYTEQSEYPYYLWDMTKPQIEIAHKAIAAQH